MTKQTRKKLDKTSKDLKKKARSKRKFDKRKERKEVQTNIQLEQDGEDDEFIDLNKSSELTAEEEREVNELIIQTKIIGYEFKIFKVKNEDGTFSSCSGTHPHHVSDCRPFLYMRNTGNELFGEIVLNDNAVIRQHQINQSNNPERLLFGDYQQTIDMISYIECLYLKMFAEVPFSKMLRSYEEALCGTLKKEQVKVLNIKMAPKMIR
jgi:hypothetical protein